MTIPKDSDLALKEWSLAVEALAQGEQILILRKGGIRETEKDFKVVHPEFLLYPTYEHQNNDLIKPQYSGQFHESYTQNDPNGFISLDYWCQVTDKIEVRSEHILRNISPFHIWTDEYANKRLRWKPSQPLTVLFLKVYKLSETNTLRIRQEYIGCKSWVNLMKDVNLSDIKPVLTDSEYLQQRSLIMQSIRMESQ